MAGVKKGSDAFAQFTIEGVAEFLREANKADPRFKKEMRKASNLVAKTIVADVRTTAIGVRHQTTGSIGANSIYTQAAKALSASSGQTPTIYLRKGRYKSRNRKRKPVEVSDVFFGAEFGGQSRSSTMQFNPYRRAAGGRGGRGQFFWPTVRRDSRKIANTYLAAVERVLQSLSGGPKS